MLARFGLAGDVFIDRASSTGTVLCFDHFPEGDLTSGTVDAVAVTDESESAWLVVSEFADPDIEWVDVLRDHGFSEARSTTYGFAAGDASTGTEPFWEAASSLLPEVPA